MTPNGYAIVDGNGAVVATCTSLPDRIAWPDGAVTQPAALMAHAHHAHTTALVTHAAALFFGAMFSGCRCGFLAMSAATAVGMENFHKLYGV